MNPDPREPDRRTDNVVSATLCAVLTIRHGDEVSRDAMAALFLATAWPTARAQNQ